MFQLTRLIPEAKGTKCNVELEPIHNTRHSTILRVPFKTEDGQDLPHWVSRFDIYPYLERYAEVCTPHQRCTTLKLVNQAMVSH